jgi:hypothetical protein
MHQAWEAEAQYEAQYKQAVDWANGISQQALMLATGFSQFYRRCDAGAIQPEPLRARFRPPCASGRDATTLQRWRLETARERSEHNDSGDFSRPRRHEQMPVIDGKTFRERGKEPPPGTGFLPPETGAPKSALKAGSACRDRKVA